MISTIRIYKVTIMQEPLEIILSMKILLRNQGKMIHYIIKYTDSVFVS